MQLMCDTTKTVGEHVFHVLREPSAGRGTSTSQGIVLQRACLLELVNLIDVDTENQAYLSMDDIETTNVNMLGSEALESHVHSTGSG